MGGFAAEFGGTNKHLLTLLSLAVGVYAQRAIELGVGPSTRALRAAMQITGGRLGVATSTETASQRV